MSLMLLRNHLSNRLSARQDSHAQGGIWIMILAMLLIPSVDVLAKLLSTDLSPVQITFLRVAFQSVFMLIAIRRLPRLLHSFPLTRKLLLCCLFVNMAVIFMVWGLAYLPVANAVALFFIEPLLVMLLSAVLLKEKSTPIKYMLAVVGLSGTLVVIRPEWQLYGWSSTLPMLSALFYALYLITIRTTRNKLSTAEAQAYISLVGTVLLAALLLAGPLLTGLGQTIPLLNWGDINSHHYGFIVLLGFFSALTHWLISTAYTLSPASMLAPFRYIEILGAAALGYLVFNELPDALTWLGMAIILGAGLAIVYLERK
ncbi:MAG: DMT family transporter [Marinobacterium sp.]|nr:DMT family transporter [Marinobacterium sp.]